MPRSSHAPSHTRIFGRLDKFDIECPACGEILRAGLTPRSQLRRQRHQTEREALAALQKQGSRGSGVRSDLDKVFQPLTSTLRCVYCRAVYQVGIILWPSRVGRQVYQIPEDQKPTRRQLAQLRRYAGGFAADKVKARGEALNVFVTAECTCPVTEGGWTPSCPIHGMTAEETEEADHAEATDEDGAEATIDDPEGGDL